MLPSPAKIVVCAGARTPIGHIARSLAARPARELMRAAVAAILERSRVPKDALSGLLVGWVGQGFDAPNIARVTLLEAGLPESAQAVTVQNNCISSIESVAAASRFILAGEGDLFIAGGTESMSHLPYTIAGHRGQKELRSLEALKSAWAGLPQSTSVRIIDAMEQGLTDPVKNINMAGTAEVCAQMYGISRQAQDAYAHESFRRTIEGWNKGFYASHVVPFEADGQVVLDKDEYPFLREDLVAKPQMLAKAPALFDNSAYRIQDFYRDFGAHIQGRAYGPDTKGTVTLFNSCGRSDGAAAVLVTTAPRAKELGLETLGEIKGWGFYGNNPAHMGVSPALAAPLALKRAGISFDALDLIELHEPFAATVLSIFKIGRERFGHDWEAKHREGKLNPHGGSIALGHPLGATGTRLLLNLLYGLKANGGRFGMIAACAGGGMGGAMVVERY
ncbi:MAG: thiolase family protein [Elusimicrobia bacterium]|nr:thiolase family protein [Elusimicrobiota bacterium]